MTVNYILIIERNEIIIKDKYNLTIEQNIFLAKRNLVDNIYSNIQQIIKIS